MTLILTVNGPETIWLLADRRLSDRGHVVRDDACKVIVLETTDGLAILGYSGLGATSHGTEPSAWMSSVLRGINVPLEQSLEILANAMRRQLPPHLMRLPKDTIAAQFVGVTAFVNGEARLYSIDLVLTPDRKNSYFRYTRYTSPNTYSNATRTPRFYLTGTGGLYLAREKEKLRNLLNLVKANDHGKLSANVVSDYLASLNNDVYLGIKDNSVGPNCIVVWRHSKEGFHKGGGAHQCYIGVNRDPRMSFIPIISGGMDMKAIGELMMPSLLEMSEKLQRGEPFTGIDDTDLNAKLAKLPIQPNEDLH